MSKVDIGENGTKIKEQDHVTTANENGVKQQTYSFMQNVAIPRFVILAAALGFLLRQHKGQTHAVLVNSTSGWNIITTTIHMVNCTCHISNYNFCIKLNHDNRTIFFFFLQIELQMIHTRQNT